MKLKPILSRVNKKAQLDSTIVFVGIVLILLFMAPYIMKIVLTPVQKLSTAFSTIDPSNKTSNEINFVQNKFTGMFDWILMFFLIFNIILILITAFLVDIHPAFLIVYFNKTGSNKGSMSNSKFSIKNGYPNYKQFSKILKNLASLI